MVNLNANYKVYNSEVSLDTELSSGYTNSFTHSTTVADISMGIIMVYRLHNWHSGFYFGGGYAVFEKEDVPAQPGGIGAP